MAYLKIGNRYFKNAQKSFSGNLPKKLKKQYF
jgi:hypothetical protein